MRNLIRSSIGLTVAALFFTGCNMKLTEDLSKIPDFHALTFTAESSSIEEDVDLYVDYSTCVSEAISSNYYRAVHPTIVDCSPTFFSIKGSNITEETSDRQKVYELLRSIREINHAEIKNAVGDIVGKNKQAVLITDGEYFVPNVTGDNMNNPYLADHFRTWLRKGYDIYIYSEPYVESGKYDKFRYYMIFTDSKLNNNIQQKFERSAPKDTSVKLFHLNNSLPQIEFKNSYPVINECLSFNPETYIKGDTFECQEYQTSWKDIYKYIFRYASDEFGNPLEEGDYIFRGIRLKENRNNSYKVEDIDLEVYHISAPYEAMLESLEEGEPVGRITNLQKANKVFVVDKKALKETGELIVRLDPGFDGSSLKTDEPNLLRVDLVLKKTTENFTENNEINKNFEWKSISSRNEGRTNTSVFESIKQVVLDETLKPENHHNYPVLYSIYISTLSNK